MFLGKKVDTESMSETNDNFSVMKMFALFISLKKKLQRLVLHRLNLNHSWLRPFHVSL